MVVTCPNVGGGIGVVDGGSLLFVEGLLSTGLCVVGETLFFGLQSGRVAMVEDGHATVLDIEIPDVHDLACIDGSVYAVGTTRNEILVIDRNCGILRSWRLPGEDDSCHLNCLGQEGGHVVFSAFGDFTETRGYIERYAGQGFVRDLETGKTILDGLCQPHNPTAFRDGLLVADSGNYQLNAYDERLNLARRVPLGGYVRGIHVAERTIHVGISGSRRPQPGGSELITALLLALDADTFEEIGRIAFPSQEIYGIAPLPAAADPVAVLNALATLR